MCRWRKIYFKKKGWKEASKETSGLRMIISLSPDAAEVSYGRTCIRPYERIGAQCLFFSQPHAAWGIDETWEQAYANFYDAVATCRQHSGDLAGRIQDYGAALR